MLPARARLRHLVDAISLLESAGAVIVLEMTRGSAIDALGMVFALPLLYAAGVRIVRGLHAGLTGRDRRVDALGRLTGPPARLGRSAAHP